MSKKTWIEIKKKLSEKVKKAFHIPRYNVSAKMEKKVKHKTFLDNEFVLADFGLCAKKERNIL